MTFLSTNLLVFFSQCDDKIIYLNLRSLAKLSFPTDCQAIIFHYRAKYLSTHWAGEQFITWSSIQFLPLNKTGQMTGRTLGNLVRYLLFVWFCHRHRRSIQPNYDTA